MIAAQITDMHVKEPGHLSYRKVDSGAALARCVEHVNGLDPSPDFVIATGDLVDRGKPAEYRYLSELLSPLKMPIYLMPGNHDDRAALRAEFSSHAYLQHDDVFLNFVIEEHPVRIIALDTVIAGEPSGELCRDRLTWLDASLGAAPDHPTAIFMHHPPFLTGIRHMDAQNCRSGEALASLLQNHSQVQWMMCGHVHRSITVHWHGLTASIAPSPSHQVAFDLREDGPPSLVLEPPGYHIHHWRPDTGLITHTCVVGSFDGPHPFFENGQLID
jgi:3',5'-cyclic-AMP phosphodiesterase